MSAVKGHYKFIFLLLHVIGFSQNSLHVSIEDPREDVGVGVVECGLYAICKTRLQKVCLQARDTEF